MAPAAPSSPWGARKKHAPSPASPAAAAVAAAGRGLHSSTFQLDLSALYGIGGARGGCAARVKGVSGGAQGVKGLFLCWTRLKLS